uniref:Chromate transporter n=1 Tax=Fervidobacterium thailandense TaxID=1008305 RepID=A0A7C4CG39_9BACT
MRGINDLRLILSIFLATAKIGGVTFGGGYAMVSVMQDEFVRRKKFFTEEEFSTIVALAQSLPGPIAVNTSAMAGYRLLGFVGAVVSVVGSIFFPFLTIVAIAAVLKVNYQLLAPFVRGMKVPIFAVLIITVLKMWGKSVRNLEELCLFIVTFILVSFLKLNPVFVIGLSVFYSVLTYYFKPKRAKKR